MNRVPVPPPIGERYGRLVILAEATKVGPKRMWLCRCDCGGQTTAYGGHILSGHTTSCGCRKREALDSGGHTTHGLTTHPLYTTWVDMRRRCFNPDYKDYRRYGGRGITLCERWRGPEGFPDFLADMGERPEGTSVLPAAMLFTDEYLAYNSIGAKYKAHRRIKHLAKVYVDGDTHTQTVEGFFGLFKNGVRGVYHSISSEYLQNYLDEYAFRYNRRFSSQPMFWAMLDRIEKATPRAA